MSSSPSTSSTRGDNVSLPLQRFHFSVVHSGNVFVRYAAENTSKSFLRSPKPPEAKLRHCELVNDNGNYSLRVLKVKSGEKKVPFFNIDISSSTVITRNDKENEYGFNFQNDDTAEFYLMDATSRDVWVHQLNDCVDILNTPINSTNNSIGNSGNSPEASLVERKSSLAEPELARPAMLGRGNSKKQLSLIQVGDTSEPPMANIRRKVDSPKTTDQRKYINDSRTDSPVHIQTSLTSSPSVGNFSPGMETPGTGRTLRSANSQFGYSKVFEMEDLQFADDNEYRTSSGQLLPPEKQGMPSIDSPLSGERRLRPMNSQFGYSKVFGADDFQFEDDNDFRTSSGTLMSSAEKQATSVALAKHYSSKLSFSQVFDPDENPFGIVNPKLETDDDDDEPKLLSQQLMSLAASPMGQPFLASDSIENVEPYSEEHLDFERVPSSPTLSQTPLVDKRVEAVKAQEPTGKSPTGKSPKNKPPDPKGHGAIGSFRESPVKRLASKHNRSMKMQSMMPTLAEEGDHTTSSNDATGYTHSDQPLTIEAPMTPMTSVASTVEAGVADPSILQQQVQALILMNNHLNQALEKTEANRKTREESLQKQLKEAQEKLRNAVGKKEEAVARVAEKGAQGGKYNNTQLRLDSALLNNVALEEKVKKKKKKKKKN